MTGHMCAHLSLSLWVCVCVRAEREREREMFWDRDVIPFEIQTNVQIECVIDTNYYAKSGDDKFRGTK